MSQFQKQQVLCTTGKTHLKGQLCLIGISAWKTNEDGRVGIFNADRELQRRTNWNSLIS